jgi:hypothetical protein
MKALQFLGAIPRYVFSMAAGTFTRKAYYSPLSNIVLREVDEPKLLSENWVRVRTVYSGICGSDLNLILLRDSPSSSPFVSSESFLAHPVWVRYMLWPITFWLGLRAGDIIVLRCLLLAVMQQGLCSVLLF